MNSGFYQFVPKQISTTIIILFGLLALPPTAQANLGGNWLGFGEWLFDGQGSRCSTMTARYYESSKILQQLGGYFDCGFVGLNLGSETWDLIDGKLIQDGQIVGFYDGLNFTAKHRQPDSTVTIELNHQVSGNHMDYQEVWRGSEGQIIYTIRGRLFRKE